MEQVREPTSGIGKLGVEIERNPTRTQFGRLQTVSLSIELLLELVGLGAGTYCKVVETSVGVPSRRPVLGSAAVESGEKELVDEGDPGLHFPT